MRGTTLLSLAAALAAPMVSAVAFSGPAANSTITKGTTFDLSWSSVDTDPSNFSIYLVNFVSWPPFYTPLALDVETSLGQYAVYVPCSVDNTFGYQFNAINGTNVYVIYAQTPKFSITGDACVDSTTVPSVSASSCAAPATVTVTVSTTLSSNATAGAFGAGSTKALAAAGPNTNATTTTSSAPRVTSGGSCPDTIGWGPSGYHHPVTLSVAPTNPAGGSGLLTLAVAADLPAVTELANLANLVNLNNNAGSTSTIYKTMTYDLSEMEAECDC